jgi:hypothetical protein
VRFNWGQVIEKSPARGLEILLMEKPMPYMPLSFNDTYLRRENFQSKTNMVKLGTEGPREEKHMRIRG